ncbi:DUF6504 family protein [Paenarthrobacter sp. PH39-S1]|uniref:DUF6504 family protein n=1 Tax=Paenarthrobacter sp. PH39-S1 TaxID=3046204 RepID=UPI0024B97B13|nr:DUF6504 family protein [Paenarthrobacter sp. PH39-S1]MDJ0355479.1 DUF6504 family protein [Paenarthrobacter sp. PH39-S1]
MGTFSEPVEVIRSAAGLPLRLNWQGRSYIIGAEPLRWYERRKWWAEESRAERGHGAGLVDHEIWRIQARLDGRGPLCTFDLSHHPDSGRWRLLQVHDAVQARSA